MDKFTIAKIGKTVGLKGELKLHLLTDFQSQFQAGKTFLSDAQSLTIKSYNPNRGLVCFEGFEDIDSAKALTNAYLYATEEQTRRDCKLAKGEKFWFDMIGLDVIDDGRKLGTITEIDRIGATEYFKVKTDAAYQDIAKQFLIPNIDVYVLEKTDSAIVTTGCFDILEQS
jgi:16S rRNA processing protein RimM